MISWRELRESRKGVVLRAFQQLRASSLSCGDAPCIFVVEVCGREIAKRESEES